MPSAKTSQVTKISSSSRTVTQTFSSVQGKIGLQQSFEEISSPSRQLFLENASLRMSPGWVSGHGSLFDSPTGSLSPIKPPKTRRSSVLVKKNLVVTSTVDSFKKPAVFISPTGVKTRARRSSIYQKSGKNLLTGLDSKARRDSLAVIRSKKLVSESDYVFAVPTADSAQRKKLVSKNSRTRKAAESKSSAKKSSPKKASSKTKGNSPVKKSVKEINLLDSKKSTQLKVVTKKSSPKKEKSVRSKAKAKTPAREVELAEDNDDDDEKDFNDENDILSPRRTRKTPGKSRKRSLSTVTKSAQKRKRSPSRSPSPAKKKKSPTSKRKSSSPQKKETPKKSSSKSKKSSSSRKKKKITKDSPITSARKNSLEVSLTPLELDDSFTLKLNDSDKKKLTKKSESSKKLTPGKSAKSTTKKTPRSSAKKSSTRKTPSSNKRGSSSSNPKSSEKKSSRKSIIETTDEVAKVLEFEPIGTFDSQKDDIEVEDDFDIEDDIEIEDDISMTTTKTSLKSKTPLTSLKMKSILDSVSVPNGADKKRKTTDFVEPQSANKRRRFDMEKFEKIVASTPRDMRLDILSGRRPELSPIPGTINKNINNSLSMTKQVTIFSDKSTFLSSGPSNLSPVASTSPLIVTEVETGVFKDFVDGNDDDFDYSHISLSQKPTDPEPYLYDYDSDLDTSHSNVRPGCTIL